MAAAVAVVAHFPEAALHHAVAAELVETCARAAILVGGVAVIAFFRPFLHAIAALADELALVGAEFVLPGVVLAGVPRIRALRVILAKLAGRIAAAAVHRRALDALAPHAILGIPAGFGGILATCAAVVALLLQTRLHHAVAAELLEARLAAAVFIHAVAVVAFLALFHVAVAAVSGKERAVLGAVGIPSHIHLACVAGAFARSRVIRAVNAVAVAAAPLGGGAGYRDAGIALVGIPAIEGIIHPALDHAGAAGIALLAERGLHRAVAAEFLHAFLVAAVTVGVVAVIAFLPGILLAIAAALLLAVCVAAVAILGVAVVAFLFER